MAIPKNINTIQTEINIMLIISDMFNVEVESEEVWVTVGVGFVAEVGLLDDKFVLASSSIIVSAELIYVSLLVKNISIA